MQVQDSFFSLEVIWKDEHLLELSVTVRNEFFSGATSVYDTADSLLAFAKQIKGFPDGREHLTYEAGEKDSYGYFSVKFYLAEPGGLVGVHIYLEGDTVAHQNSKLRSKVSLQVVTEPATIDDFQKHLLTLAGKQEGRALLPGVPQG